MGFGERFSGYFNSIKENLPGKKKEEKPPLDSLINAFVFSRQLGESQLLSNIEESDIPGFQQLVERLNQRVKSGEISERGAIFKVNQLNSMIERGLETAIGKSKGQPIIERWN